MFDGDHRCLPAFADAAAGAAAATRWAVVPTIVEALRTAGELGGRGAEILAGALDAMAAAVILIDRDGGIVAMTRAARAHVEAQDAVMVREAALRAVDRASDTRLQKGMARALAAAGQAPAAQVWLASSAGPARGLIAELYSLPLLDGKIAGAPRVLVLLRGFETAPGSGQMLRQAFDLSIAEAEVAQLVAKGFTREDIAVRRGVSPQTVASQLKTIYRKAGVNSQVQLAALVARMSGR